MTQGNDMKLDPSVKEEVGGGIKPEPTALATGPTAVKPQQVTAPANGKVPKNRKRMYDSDSSIDEDEGDSSDDDEVCVLAGAAALQAWLLDATHHGSSLYLMLSAGVDLRAPDACCSICVPEKGLAQWQHCLRVLLHCKMQCSCSHI